MVFLAGYLAVNVGQSIIKTYHVRQETLTLKTQLEEMKLEKQRLEALLSYYQSDVYKEKELRRSLLLKKPNEKVYALPESSEPKSLMEGIDSGSGLVRGENKDSEEKDSEFVPNWKKWANYLLS